MRYKEYFGIIKQRMLQEGYTEQKNTLSVDAFWMLQ